MVQSVSATAISSVSAAGSVTLGQSVSFTLSPSAPLGVTAASGGGMPYLTLNNGGTATYAGVDANHDLLFSYTAAAGQTTSDLVVTGLVQNGATITSIADLRLVRATDVVTQSSAFTIATADLNGDGNMDVVTASATNDNVSVLLGDGQGGFATPVNYTVGRDPEGVSLGDVNGDGLVDIVTSNGNAGTISVLLGDGNGGFGAKTDFQAGTAQNSSYTMAMADLNGDGKLDVVTANGSEGDFSVLLGDGMGGFSTPAHFASGGQPYGVTLADVNGDGQLDIVASNTNTVSVLLGDGLGGFGTAASFAVGSTFSQPAVADLDGNGTLDIVTTNFNDATLSVLLGDGHGGFVAGQTIAVGQYPVSVKVADINGDGNPDLIVSNNDDNTVSVLLGDGHGVFSPQTLFAVGSGPGNLSIADINNDGRPDLVVGNAGAAGGSVSAYLNTSPPVGIAFDGTGIASLSGADTTIEVAVAALAPPAPVLAPVSDSGTAGDDITNVNRPALTGTGEAGSTITIQDTQGGTTTVLGTALVDGSGAWTFTPTTALTDGAHDLSAVDLNASGTASGPSATLAVTIDTVAPDAPTVGLEPTSDTGAPGDGVTKIAQPMLTGTAEAGSTVTISDTIGGTTVTLGMTIALADGTWSFTPGTALSDGAHTITAAATDAAGSTGAAGSTTVTIDRIAPVPTIGLTTDSAVPGDLITADPSLSGQSDPGATVIVTEGGQTIGSATADAAGRWSLLPTIAAGAHTVTASTTDPAGNTGMATLTFTLDPGATDFTLATGGTMQDGVLSNYAGPVAGVTRQFTFTGSQSATILARAANTYLVGGTAGDALIAQSGRNVLDGGRGANWLVAGTGQDTFMADVRGGSSWNTILGFKIGDDLVLRGIDAAVIPRLEWVGLSGVAGYTGATLRITDAVGTVSQLTLQGLTVAEASRYTASVVADPDGTFSLQMSAPPANTPGQVAVFADGASTATVGAFDPYTGTVAGLRFQYVQPNDQAVTVTALASDVLLRSGAGSDALTVFNGDNVLDAGAGSNWLVGGAGQDSFNMTVTSGHEVWDTVVNFHAGDTITLWGFDPGLSSAAWQGMAQGVAGYQGATLRGGLNGTGTDFSLTIAGLTPEQGSFLVMTSGTSNGVGYLQLRQGA